MYARLAGCVHSPTLTAPPLSTPASFPDRIIVRAIRFKLTPELHVAALAKGMRLFHHHQRVIRIRIDLERCSVKNDVSRFGATGRIEISGPDVVASAASDSAGKSLDLLVDKLDRMLRERSRHRADRRNDYPTGMEFRDFIAPRA